MTRHCSDFTRHMRLFELIRQQNLMALKDHGETRPDLPMPAGMLERWVSNAVRSLTY